MKKMLILSLTALLSLTASAQTAEEVLMTARKANNYFMKKYADPTEPTFVGRERPSNLWTRGVYYEGLMALYEVDPDERYAEYTDKWAEFHRWTARNGITTVHADDQCCQQTYIDRYIQTGKKHQYMISEVIKNLKHQMSTGKVDYWTWIDAIQMAMPVYAKLYKLTGERSYMDYAMKLYRWTRNACGGGTFNTKTGLWYRDADFVPPYKEKDGNDCYWSRGDGWVYAALVRVMGELSPKDKHYKELKKDFLLMSRALAKCQREDGLWNVSLVSPATFGGKELTGTALFLYGMSWGLRQGILKEKDYRKVCDRAWNGLEKDCVHANGFLGWVQGTGKEPAAGQPLSYTKIPDFEDFGTGCFLLGATEYYKLLKSR
ncbi:MAG: glycoside hydrolase family 88 protein [Prevotella sp.]|nr:glycoside hydrolase family 88 protein [Prevotella sp.]MDY4039675.1 glycoside hydrolase family 88 protein [Prevotella sp.]